MDTRKDSSHSPSARFYSNRQSEGPAIFDMLLHPASDEQPHPELVPPFTHFQGFSAPPSSHRYINTCAACLSDDRVSPRTPTPYHDHRKWESPRQRVEEPSDETDDIPSTGYGSAQHHVGGLLHTAKFHHSLSKPGCARQLSGPPTYITPPPQYYLCPENAPAPVFAERPVPVMLPPRGPPSGPPPVPIQYPVLRGNTIRVPSCSETSDADQQPPGPATTRRPLVANESGEIASTIDDDDADSTVYPGDSTSKASSSTASRPARGGVPIRPLEDAALEVHNICLTATQRYLESLRVNWELRHGHEMMTPLGLAGPTRRLRDRVGERGSPYAIPRRRRRALSDNSGLEHMRGGSSECHHCAPPMVFRNGEAGVRSPQHACPVPAPTDSLLQNTSHICELIWRRGCRDRQDVMGAEAGAARSIGLLVESSETVVLYDADEWERDPRRGFYMACEAGRNLCRELGDSEGGERVDGIERGGF